MSVYTKDNDLTDKMSYKQNGREDKRNNGQKNSILSYNKNKNKTRKKSNTELSFNENVHF